MGKVEHIINKENNNLVTPEQAAKIINKSLSSIRALITKRKIKVYKSPNGRVKLDKQELLSLYQNTNKSIDTQSIEAYQNHIEDIKQESSKKDQTIDQLNERLKEANYNLARQQEATMQLQSALPNIAQVTKKPWWKFWE